MILLNSHLNSLQNEFHEHSTNISIEEVDKLILSMARRIEAVLASKGYRTKY